jgi:DNA-binding NarL/FixJ family response regulator
MSIKILIADDHSIFIDGMKALLEAVKDIQVVGSAANGEEAVLAAAELKPDVVLIDIQMPVKNGIEASKEILKSLPDTKIVVLTMLDESMNIKRMLEAGVHGYLLKTTDKDELLSVIHKVMSGQKHFSAEVTAKLMNDYSRSGSSGSLVELLTKREKEILIHIAKGLTDKEIAEKVFLSPFTVITHRKNLLSKLNLKNKVELARFAIEHNLV